MTRFAVDPGGGAGLQADSAWLAIRLDLFEKYCAPGMAAQTTRPLAWLLFVDWSTPEWVVERLSLIAPGSTTVRLDGPWSAERVTRVLASRGLGGRPTLGLDSDDVLLPDCLERMCASVARRGDGLHSMPIGLQLAGSGLYWRCYVQNPFVCFFAADSPRHVFDLDHWDVKGERLHIVDWNPGWVQVIHGGNLANEIRGVYVRGIGFRRLLARMGIRPEVPPAARATALGLTMSSAIRYVAIMLRRVPTLIGLAVGRARRKLA
jgi:hypothetical protein